MLAVLISKWVSDAIQKDGIYEATILLNQLPFLDNKTEYRFASRACDVMSKGLCVLDAEGNTVSGLTKFLAQHRYTGFPIVYDKDDMQVAGYISRQELRQALEKAKQMENVTEGTPCYFLQSSDPSASAKRKKTNYVNFEPWVDETPLQIAASTPLNLVFDMFKKLGLRYILITYRGVLIGVITKKDILQHIAASKKHKHLLTSPKMREKASLLVRTSKEEREPQDMDGFNDSMTSGGDLIHVNTEELKSALNTSNKF